MSKLDDLSEETLLELSKMGVHAGSPRPNDATMALYDQWMDSLRDKLTDELEVDKTYYEDHPDNTFLMRLAFPNERFYYRLVSSFTGEYIDESTIIAVIIKRTAPKEMIRLPIVYNPRLSPTEEEMSELSQFELSEIWDKVISMSSEV